MQQPPNNWQQQPPNNQGQPPQQPYPPQDQSFPPAQQPPNSYGGGGGYSYDPPPEQNWMVIGGIAAAVVSCLLVVGAVICVITLSSGDSDSDDPTAVDSVASSAPTVNISQPTDGQTFAVGSTITVQAQASDQGGGVTRVELRVNNVVVDSQTSQDPLGEESLSVLLDYTAVTAVDNLRLVVRAYRGSVQSPDVSVNVTVQGSATTPTSAATTSTNNNSGNTGNNAPAPATQNPTCRARIDVGTLNFRRGPSVDYDILGVFNLGAEPPVVGRLGDNSWWEVSSNGSRGWVSAAYTELLGNCQNISVTTPPASPVPAATNTPIPQEPNLIVSTLTGSTAITLLGQEATATYIVRVRNDGDTNAEGQFNITITYPDGTSFDYTVDGLAAGEEVEVPNISATFTAPGTYTLSVFADSSGNITESVTSDNQEALTIVVSEPTPTPEDGS